MFTLTRLWSIVDWKIPCCLIWTNKLIISFVWNMFNRQHGRKKKRAHLVMTLKKSSVVGAMQMQLQCFWFVWVECVLWVVHLSIYDKTEISIRISNNSIRIGSFGVSVWFAFCNCDEIRMWIFRCHIQCVIQFQWKANTILRFHFRIRAPKLTLITLSMW